MTEKVTFYYAMRTHCHTDRQKLWKVMSCRMRIKKDAEFQAEFEASMEKNPDHEFFVVAMEEDATEDELQLRKKCRMTTTGEYYEDAD